MANLNLKQLNRIVRLRELVDHGDIAVTKHLFDIEDQITLMNEVFTRIEEDKRLREKGEDGDPGLNGQDGNDGRDGINGRDGRDGLDGADGKDGKDGIDGIDGVNGRDGSPDNPQQIADKVNTLYEKIKPEVIIGWGDLQNKIRNQVPRDFDVRIGVSKTEMKGLRDRVEALEAGGGSGSGVTVETPTGDVDDSNTTFTVTAEPKWVIVNGITYFDGAGYSYASLTLTLNGPVGTGGFIRSIY